jgi:hypothetical protein
MVFFVLSTHYPDEKIIQQPLFIDKTSQRKNQYVRELFENHHLIVRIVDSLELDLSNLKNGDTYISASTSAIGPDMLWLQTGQYCNFTTGKYGIMYDHKKLEILFGGNGDLGVENMRQERMVWEKEKWTKEKIERQHVETAIFRAGTVCRRQISFPRKVLLDYKSNQNPNKRLKAERIDMFIEASTKLPRLVTDTNEELLTHIYEHYKDKNSMEIGKNEIIVNAKYDSLLGLFYVLNEKEDTISPESKNVLCAAQQYARENFNQMLPTYVLNEKKKTLDKILCELNLPEINHKPKPKNLKTGKYL